MRRFHMRCPARCVALRVALQAIVLLLALSRIRSDTLELGHAYTHSLAGKNGNNEREQASA